MPRLSQKRALVVAGLAMDQRERHVAAEDGAAFAREAAGEAFGERADAGNRHHAKRDAEDQNIEAAKPAAQFAQGETTAAAAMPRGGGTLSA